MKENYNKFTSRLGAVLFPGCAYVILICLPSFSFSQGDTWQQKQSLGLVASARSQALSFNIGGKGYVGSGMDIGIRNDFWEYDPATNVWTQKADVPGAGYLSATGFNIGNKGYICAGNRFWEYDPAVNGWTPKADFPGGNGAAGFGIGNKGYVGNLSVSNNNFWEFDPATNAWTQKANFSAPVRLGASGFSIANKGYIGLGGVPAGPPGIPPSFFYNDLWEYDPAGDIWVQKANFAGAARWQAVAFSVGNKGFVGTGNNLRSLNDFWQYDPATNAWVQKANIGGEAREQAIGFGIGDKGYIGTGNRTINDYAHGPVNDFWAYDTVLNTWTQKADFGGGPRMNAVGFSIADKGYVGTGFDGSPKKDFWEYDPVVNQWQQKADFAGGRRREALGFGQGAKGYLGTGWVIARFSFNRDLWQYDPASGVWNSAGTVPGYLPGRAGAFACSIGGKEYVGGGFYYADAIDDLWEFDPATAVWTQKSLPPDPNGVRLNFGIGNKGYAVGDVNWEYDPATNVWTQKASSGITGIAYTFSTKTKGYALAGNNDLWEYDPANDTWAKRAKFPGSARTGATAFSIGDNGYFGFGNASDGLKNDFWEYIPPSLNAITTSVASDTFCSRSTLAVSFVANGTFDPGNIFTAELSDAAGGFSRPTIVGTDTSATSGMMNVTLPDSLSSGQAYRIRVVSSNPGITGGDNGVNLVINPPPVARAKNPTIYLNISGIARLRPEDVDNGSLAYCGILTSKLDDTMFNCREIGLNKVALTVTDGNGNKATDTAVVTVTDSLKPLIEDAFVVPGTLWPPDHKMRRVRVYYRAEDNCCIASKELSVISNEPSPGNRPDWIILDDHHLLLRAEVNEGRRGIQKERIYFITVTVRDSAGNSAAEVLKVVVSRHHKRDAHWLGWEDYEANVDDVFGKAETEANRLMVTARPNPSQQSFTLDFRSKDDLALLVRVVDNFGRLIETRTNVTPNRSLQIGNTYPPGDYYVQVIQGDDKVTLHLVKLRN